MPELKYKIEKLLMETPRGKSLSSISSELGVPQRTFDRDRKIKLSDRQDIPTERLACYARYFNVSVESLLNYEVRISRGSNKRPSTFIKKVGLSSTRKKSRK